MDSRSHHSWSHPQSHIPPRDPGPQVPLMQQPSPYHPHGASPSVPPPPPPAATQRPQSYFNNESLVSRHNHRIGADSEMQSSRPSFAVKESVGMHQYAASRVHETPISEREQTTQGPWPRSRNGRDDRGNPQLAEAPSALPPPPPSTGFRSSLETLHVLDDSMRHSQPRSSSPRMYGAQSSLPPPPPPAPPVVPYGSRHMRPPSSPQYGSAPIPREPPVQSPISRDLPALPTSTRPTSSMSISSMLGTDPGRPSRDPPLSAHPNTSQPIGSYSSLSHYSTSNASPSRPPNGSGPEYQGSPPAQSAMSGILNRPFRAYSGGSSGAGKPSSPSANIIRFEPSSTGSINQNSPRSAGVQERMYDPSRNLSVGRAIDRPNSQPLVYNASPIDFDQRAREIDARRAEVIRQEEEILRNGTGFADRARSSKYDTPSRHRQDTSGQGAHSAPQRSPRNSRTQAAGYSLLSNPSGLSETSTKGSKGEYSYTPRDRVITDDQEPQQVIQKGPFSTDELKRLRDHRLGATAIQQQQDPSPVSQNARPRYLDTIEGRQDQIDNRRLSTVSSATAMERTKSVDSVGRGSEDLNNHRHSLAIMLENNKRGRFSPLPQVVQGAQSRPSNTPSRDPGIKNEFSKVFMGLGSGVTGVGSGASTPFPPSPRQSVENEQRPFGPPSEAIKITETRNGSRMGKRKPKAKDDEIENNDGRAVGTSADGRGLKRAKHSHRHHVHGHHHHRDEGTPLRNMSNPNGSTPAPHHNHHLHHHHHADGTIHHHHHTHNRQPAPVAEKTPPPPRIPRTIINNTAVLSAVAHRPHHHLGSTVYAPTMTSTPFTSPNPKIEDMVGSYAMPPQYGKENCTLTIRIPRYYLTHSNLLRTTASHAIWGTDIYTDDSDPLCAAIHGGWIRGAWPAAIDASLIEPDLRNVNLIDDAPAVKDTVLDAPPSSGPMIVPTGKDMHITVIILPALQYYSSRVAHGVKSRLWGADHEGLSFQIEKIAFLDGGEAAGEEKKAMVRKERIAASVEALTEKMPQIHLRTARSKRPAVKPVMKAMKEVAAAA